MYANKRRRIDEASVTLAKPFRSPLKTPGKTSIAQSGESVKCLQHNANATTNVLLKDSEPTEDSQNAVFSCTLSSMQDTSDNCSSSPTQKTTSQNSLVRPKASPQGLQKPRVRNQRAALGDPAMLALQKNHASLNARLSTLTANLDTLNQSYNILTSSSDTELESLIYKWRVASREAAEELFSTAKDRVNKMGGVGIWRERMTKRSMPFGDSNGKDSGWSNQDEDIDEDELDEEQKAMLESMREEKRRDQERYQNVASGIEVGSNVEGDLFKGGDDDESFTMDMMLQQLNVELDVIGYDKQLQRWLE